MNPESTLAGEGYNYTVCIPILSSGGWREMSVRRSPGAQIIKLG